MADTVNEIAKWLDEESVPQPDDTETVPSQHEGQPPEAKDGSLPTDVVDAPDDKNPVTSDADAEDPAEIAADYNQTVVLKDSISRQALLDAKVASDQGEEESPRSSEEGSLTEYNSAVNYISDLIDQLRVPESGKPSDPTEHRTDQLPTDQTCVLAHEELDSLGIGNTIPIDSALAASMQAASPEETPSLLDEAESEQGYAYRRSLLHSLREAAHLATNTSLELNDCSRYAHRAYYAGFFGCASAFFSIVFVLMSPKAGTFGFAASIGAFSVAVCLALVYLLSYRAFLRIALRLRTPSTQTAPINVHTS